MLAIIMFTIVIITLTVAAVIVKIPVLFVGVFVTSIVFLFSVYKYVEDSKDLRKAYLKIKESQLELEMIKEKRKLSEAVYKENNSNKENILNAYD